MQPIGYIKNIDSGATYIAFYKQGKAKIINQLYERIYDEHGINIPSSKINTKYPEISDRQFKRIYSDDGELFHRAFLEFEFHRINSHKEYEYIKV